MIAIVFHWRRFRSRRQQSLSLTMMLLVINKNNNNNNKDDIIDDIIVMIWQLMLSMVIVNYMNSNHCHVRTQVTVYFIYFIESFVNE